MEIRRVFIVGDSLFAETLAQMLEKAEGIEVTGSAPTAEAARAKFETKRPDAVIVAGTGDLSAATLGDFLSTYPDLHIIRADLTATDLQVVTSRRIGARRANLVDVIHSLPARQPKGDKAAP